MGKKFIFNADDFGFSEAFNLGVIHGHVSGIISSASLMPNMAAAEHAAALAKKHPKLAISQHTNFVQGYCLSDPAKIPSLVKSDGAFYRSGEYVADGFLKKSGGTRVPEKEDVKRETLAQLARFKELLGYYPTHLEGHSILHPSILEAFEEIAAEFGMHYMSMKPDRQAGYLEVYEGFDPALGDVMTAYNQTGYTVEMLKKTLTHIAENPYEVTVIHCHPGYVDAYLMDNTSLVLPRCRDLETACNPEIKTYIQQLGLTLVDFNQIRADE